VLEPVADGSQAKQGGYDPAHEVLDVVEAAEEAGTGATVTSVAEALAVDQPRASRLVQAAVTAGLVERGADQAGGRWTLLVRTDLGREVSDRIHERRRAVFRAAMADWTAGERAEFARLLTRFVDALPQWAV
jgi:DNA-binding MarR family transcriptional regulator